MVRIVIKDPNLITQCDIHKSKKKTFGELKKVFKLSSTVEKSFSSVTVSRKSNFNIVTFSKTSFSIQS